MLKVMIFSPEYPPLFHGGLGTHVVELVKGLSRVGCEVTVVVPYITPINFKLVEPIPNVTVHWMPTKQAFANTPMPSTYWQCVIASNNYCISQMSDLVERYGHPDIIHCHDFFGCLPALELKRLTGAPLISTIHLFYPVMEWWGEKAANEIIELEKRLCHAADALITVSHSQGRLIEQTYGIEKQRIHIVYNGFNPSLFYETKLSSEEAIKLKQLYAQPDEKIVIFAGRMNAQKGILPLIASAAKVIEQQPKTHYLIAGGRVNSWGYTKQQLQEAVTTHSPELLPKISLLGKISREQLARLYHIADIAIIPSIYEPFGYAAIEAMAAGVPVVATEVGGLSEIIESGKTGLLSPVIKGEDGQSTPDINELAAAQLMLLKDERLAQEIGQAGQKQVIQEFTLEKMVQSTLQVYHHVS